MLFMYGRTLVLAQIPARPMGPRKQTTGPRNLRGDGRGAAAGYGSRMVGLNKAEPENAHSSRLRSIKAPRKSLDVLYFRHALDSLSNPVFQNTPEH